MATPVINSVTPTSVTLNPGESQTFTVDASDADVGTGQISVTVTDGSGNVSQPVVVPVTFTDPLTLTVTPSAGFPGSVSVSGMTFTVTA